MDVREKSLRVFLPLSFAISRHPEVEGSLDYARDDGERGSRHPDRSGGISRQARDDAEAIRGLSTSVEVT